MDVKELEDHFAVPGMLSFGAAASGLAYARVTAPAGSATVYLHGAHVTDWKPEGYAPVLFLSERTELQPGQPIRGGVPVIFPWFGPRHDGKPGPSHGFARTSEWELAFAAIAGDEVHLTFTLAPNEASRALGFDRFRLAYTVAIGRTLKMELTVANDDDSPLVFEEALHTYFAVADVERTMLSGLAETEYLDKRDGMSRKRQPEGAMSFTGTTDRVYLDTTSTCTIADVAGKRKIVVEKAASHTTVVWNPWAEVAATLPDMNPDGWHTMLCVESANVGDSAVTLAQGETHTMRVTVSVEEAG